MKYIYIALIAVLLVVGGVIIVSESHTEPTEELLILNLDTIKGLTRIGVCNE
jgi:uncharacterized membrane-anchored protein